MAGRITDPFSSPTSQAQRKTTAAPPNEPMLQNAWNRLITGIGRAFSTATPSAFIATSVAPLPRPRRTPATTASGNEPANARTAAPAIISGSAVSVTRRAPTRSAIRPPTCIETTAATPTMKRSTASIPASMPRRVRSAGSTPAQAPMARPLIAKTAPTATTAPRLPCGTPRTFSTPEPAVVSLAMTTSLGEDARCPAGRPSVGRKAGGRRRPRAKTGGSRQISRVT